MYKTVVKIQRYEFKNSLLGTVCTEISKAI